MTETATVNAQAPSTDQPHANVRPRCGCRRRSRASRFAAFRRRMLHEAFDRYGQVFAINIPFFGRTVLVSDPAVVRRCSWRAPTT